MGGEALFGKGARGDDDDRASAKSKKGDGAVSLGYAGQSVVEGLFEKMEVADEGERRRTRRQLPSASAGTREHKFDKDKESNGQEDSLEIEGKHCKLPSRIGTVRIMLSQILNNQGL